MAKIYLVRHGQAAANWDEDLDPPLSELGREQARQAAVILKDSLANSDSLRCYSSPIKRAYQTAEAFADISGQEIHISKAVAEIPSADTELAARMDWLKQIMSSSWPQLPETLQQWRQQCIDFVAGLDHDAVIFSHYIAINVLIGHCQGKAEVICYPPDNCSIHEFHQSGSLQLVKLGRAAQTRIN